MIALLLGLLLLATPAGALPSATASAVLDWQDFAFTTTGTLVVERLDQRRVEIFDGGDGLLNPTLAVVGEADAIEVESADWLFWLYGSGSGALELDLPYTLTVTLALPAPTNHGTVWAGVAASIGIGVGPPGEFAHAGLTLDTTGTLTQTGILHVTRYYDRIDFGPLEAFSAGAGVTARTRVPEPATWLLVGAGLVGVGVWRRVSSAAEAAPDGSPGR